MRARAECGVQNDVETLVHTEVPSFWSEYNTRFCIAKAVSYLNSEDKQPLQLVDGAGSKSSRSCCAAEPRTRQPFFQLFLLFQKTASIDVDLTGAHEATRSQSF